ncbi:MAG: cysteine desulfurase [Ignavibacteriae bacterium]|nr:MAG: cysteine desulfurase [Ignavibacteriota bacterium]
MDAVKTKPAKSFNIDEIRKDFPILERTVHGKPLVYLDNAATSQKPQAVIDSHVDFYLNHNANIHRGVYQMSTESTDAYDESRTKVKEFINAPDSREIIFTRGTTESINLVSNTFGRFNVKSGDEIIVSTMEHHANIVPWQILCGEKNAMLRVIPINEKGELLMDEYKKLLNEKTKLVSVTHISNTLGTINPVKEIIELAHEKKIPVMIDGAQAVAHMRVDVRDLDCDFYAFSGHKMFGPTGIGVLYGKAEYLEAMPPYQGGGDMIRNVSFEKTTYGEIPTKFEAGTPNIAGSIGLGIAIDYLNKLDFNQIHEHEMKMLNYATNEMEKIEGVRIIGTAKNKASVISFIVEGINPMDLGIMLDTMGVAVRTGQHCTEPLMTWYCIPGTVRASFAMYNRMEEVDIFIKSLKKAISILK